MGYKPDKLLLHTMTVIERNFTGKVFNSASGQKEKWLIKFAEHDYEAEWTPLVGTSTNDLFKLNEKATFRIAFRKDYRDEIEPATALADHGSSTETGKTIYSMGGHPAITAILVAKDLAIANAVGQAKTKAQPILLSDVLAQADEVLIWLTKKANGES